MLKSGKVLLLVVLVCALSFGSLAARPNSCYEDGKSRLHNERFNKGCMTCDCIDGKVECFDSERLCPQYMIAAGCKTVPNPKKNDGTGKHCCKVVVCETREPSRTSPHGGPSGTTTSTK